MSDAHDHLNEGMMNEELSSGNKMDEPCSTFQEFSVQGIPETFSLKENNSDYVCNLCNRSFAKKPYLNKHLKIHLAKRPHACEICSKSFTRGKDLKEHLMTHSGEKPHLCYICKKAFTRKCILTNHLLIHSGEKPHICYICKKSFTRKGHLKAHLLTHSGEKPHVCHICKKSFTQQGHLKGHLLTHSGEKSHVCNICSMAFVKKCNLTRHLLRHCKKTDVDSSLDREEELPSTSGKSMYVNSDSQLSDTCENTHENNPVKLEVKEEIVYLVENHNISDERKWDIDVGEVFTKSDAYSQEMSCDLKEENIHDEMNGIV